MKIIAYIWEDGLLWGWLFVILLLGVASGLGLSTILHQYTPRNCVCAEVLP